MKRILILANNDVGLYKFRKELIQELLKKHSVFISLPDGELVQELIQMGCQFIDTPVDRRGINPMTDLQLLKRYRQILRTIKPDLVITYTIKPNIYGGLVARSMGIAYAINITGLGTAFQNDNFIRKLVCFLYKKACKKAKVVFFENQGNRDLFHQFRLIQADQACTLNGAGVNLNEYSFAPYPQEQKNIRFLFIGRVMKEKGIDELLTAARRIKNENQQIFFDIVGPMEDDYKQTIDSAVNDGIIQYYGFQSDVKPFIRQCHCFVLPSYHEGMANTLLESAAMGRPLITSNIHGCMEAVSGNGYTCSTKDADDLYDKLNRFSKLSHQEKVQLGLRSRKHMEQVFDKKKVVRQTIQKLQLLEEDR